MRVWTPWWDTSLGRSSFSRVPAHQSLQIQAVVCQKKDHSAQRSGGCRNPFVLTSSRHCDLAHSRPSWRAVRSGHRAARSLSHPQYRQLLCGVVTVALQSDCSPIRICLAETQAQWKRLLPTSWMGWLSLHSLQEAASPWWPHLVCDVVHWHRHALRLCGGPISNCREQRARDDDGGFGVNAARCKRAVGVQNMVYVRRTLWEDGSRNNGGSARIDRWPTQSPPVVAEQVRYEQVNGL